MRGIGENAVFGTNLTAQDPLQFRMNGNHGITEAVQFGLRFTLGGFDHHGSDHRPGHRGSMNSIIHKSFGHINFRELCVVSNVPQIQNEFVCDAAVRSGIEDVEIRSESVGHIVGVENRHLRRSLESFRCEQGDVGP